MVHFQKFTCINFTYKIQCFNKDFKRHSEYRRNDFISQTSIYMLGM